jgi:hypothetical protein
MAWVQFFAAFGFGTIVAALLSRAVAIAGFRQKWIDALRDDLVAFMKEIDVLHFRLKMMETRGEVADLEKQQEARNAALLAYRRVLMRLNMTEELHVNLMRRMKELTTINSNVADAKKVDAVVNASREVLKYEWAVAKYGIFLPIMAPKQWRKKRRARDIVPTE